MEAAFNCETATLPARDALRERFERIEAKAAILRELNCYLAACRRNRITIEEQVEA